MVSPLSFWFHYTSFLPCLKVALSFVFAGPCEIVLLCFSFASNSQAAGSLGKREDPAQSANGEASRTSQTR
jgi:hypothetical protein